MGWRVGLGGATDFDLFEAGDLEFGWFAAAAGLNGEVGLESRR